MYVFCLVCIVHIGTYPIDKHVPVPVPVSNLITPLSTTTATDPAVLCVCRSVLCIVHCVWVHSPSKSSLYLQKVVRIRSPPVYLAFALFVVCWTLSITSPPPPPPPLLITTTTSTISFQHTLHLPLLPPFLSHPLTPPLLLALVLALSLNLCHVPRMNYELSPVAQCL